MSERALISAERATTPVARSDSKHRIHSLAIQVRSHRDGRGSLTLDRGEKRMS